MHTLAKNAAHNERLIYDFLNKAYPSGTPTFKQLVQDNIINGTQLLELAVSNVEGIPMCPVGYNRDLIDDSDVKTVTVLENTYYKRKTLKSGKKRRYKVTVHVARIQRVDKKFGVLRIICFNPFSGKYHYFKIPPSAVYGLNTLAITFDRDTNLPAGKYAEFEVDSFEGMSSKLSLREQIDTLVCNVNKNNITQQLDEIMDVINKVTSYHVASQAAQIEEKYEHDTIHSRVVPALQSVKATTNF